MNQKNWAQVAYEAYCRHTDNKSLITGATLPRWELLKPEVQGAWAEAALAVTEAVEKAYKAPRGS